MKKHRIREVKYHWVVEKRFMLFFWRWNGWQWNEKKYAESSIGKEEGSQLNYNIKHERNT